MTNDNDLPSRGMRLAQQAKVFLLRAFLLALAAALIYAAVALWPSDFFNTPFGQMTINMLLRFVGAITIFVIGIGVLIFSQATFDSLPSPAQAIETYTNETDTNVGNPKRFKRLGLIILAAFLAALLVAPVKVILSILGIGEEVQNITGVVLFWSIFALLIWYMKRRQLHVT